MNIHAHPHPRLYQRLMHAAYDGDVVGFQALLTPSALKKLRDTDFHWAFKTAIECGHEDLIDAMLLGCPNSHLMVVDNRYCPLHDAIRSADDRLLGTLLPYYHDHQPSAADQQKWSDHLRSIFWDFNHFFSLKKSPILFKHCCQFIDHVDPLIVQEWTGDVADPGSRYHRSPLHADIQEHVRRAVFRHQLSEATAPSGNSVGPARKM